jgi:hypothetical protein
MNIQDNKQQMAMVEEQVELALKMEIESQRLEDSRHAPEIAPGGFKPIEVGTPGTSTATMTTTTTPTAKLTINPLCTNKIQC